MGCGTLIGIGILLLIIAASISSILSPDTKTSSTSPQPSTQTNASPQTAQQEAKALPGAQWLYSQYSDPMGKGTVYGAQVVSSNTVDFDFPYNGAQHATLALRSHPRFGKDVILRIEKGQFLCPSYEGCNVLIRFDEEQGATYSAAGATDNSTETIFVHNYSRFLQKMLKAKQVRIAVNIYQEGAPVFDFDVSNFSQSKYKPNN
jgi:hypothetical protein